MNQGTCATTDALRGGPLALLQGMTDQASSAWRARRAARRYPPRRAPCPRATDIRDYDKPPYVRQITARCAAADGRLSTHCNYERARTFGLPRGRFSRRTGSVGAERSAVARILAIIGAERLAKRRTRLPPAPRPRSEGRASR